MRQVIALTALFSLTILLSLYVFASPSLADVDDYHPVTGMPNCMKCHTPDRKYSIDYTREESCFECHDPALSDRFIEIDSRFKTGETEDRLMLLAQIDTTPPTQIKPRKIDHKDMAFVPAGEFTMGSNDWWPKSQPEHVRNLPAFYIDKYEVSNIRYKAFVDATGQEPPKHWNGNVIIEGRENHPVVNVNWYEADAFCKWEGKRLPTEPEWEKAARGADKRTFPWGDKFDRNKGNTPQLGLGDTTPVGSFPGGESPHGVYDMAGNAFEWVSDWFQPYEGNTHPDENYGERYKSVRGGSWYDCTYYKCGISAPTFNRIFFHPYTRNGTFGFRCAGDG